MAVNLKKTQLYIPKDSVCRVECVLVDDGDVEEDILFINSGHSSASCQTDTTYFDTFHPRILGVPILYCGQPSPGTATTQCFIPHLVDACISTEPLGTYSDTCLRTFSSDKPAVALPTHTMGTVKAITSSLKKEARELMPGITWRGASSSLAVKSKAAVHTSCPEQPHSTPHTLPVLGPKKRGRKRKVSCAAGDEDNKKSLSCLPSLHTKVSGKRGKRKNRDDDFEYDLVENSEENVKIECEVNNDDRNKNWRGEELLNVDNKKGENERESLKSRKQSREISMISPLLGLNDECGDESDYKTPIDEVIKDCEDSSEDSDNYEDEEDEDEEEDSNISDSEKNRVLKVGINDLASESGVSKRLKKYSEKAKEKYHQEKIIKEDGKVIYRCLKCSEEFGMRLQLKEHRKVHAAKVRLYECSHCDKVFTEARKYYSHLGFHDRLFKCRSCGQRFSLLGNLKKHLSTHQGAPDQVCEVCGNQFLTPNQLRLHHQTKHSEDSVRAYKMECAHCGKKYVREEAYNQHLSRAPYKCSLCDASLGCESKLKTHVRSQHGRCVCEFCGKSFKKNSLIHHIKVVHREACVQCPQCPKKFAYRSKMLAHLDGTHTQEKKYKCSICSYAARTINTLNLHRRKRHMDPSLMPQYGCDLCSRKFSLPSKLTLHYRVHTGEKPFKCTTCGKAFATKYNMSEHQRCVHGERVQLRHPDGTTSVRTIKHRRAPRAPGRRCELCGLDLPSYRAMVTHMKEEHDAQTLPNTPIKVDRAGEVLEAQEVEEEAQIIKYEVSDEQCGVDSGGRDQELLLPDSSNIVNIPEYATHVEIDGVEYQVLRQ